MRQRRINMVAFLAVVVIGTVASARAEARTLNFPSAYPTLQAAVNSAQDGDVIVVESRLAPYLIGTVTIDNLITGLTMVGTDPSVAVLEGNIVLQLNVSSITTSDFYRLLSFIANGGSTLTLQNLTIRRPSGSSTEVGVAYTYDVAVSRLSVINCVIENWGQGSGIAMAGTPRGVGRQLSVTHSALRNNRYGIGMGSGGNQVTVTRSVIANNSQYGILGTDGNQTVDLQQSVVALNGAPTIPERAGIRLQIPTTGQGVLRTKDTTFYGNRTSHYTLSGPVTRTDLGNTVYLDLTNGQTM